jgi:sugar diacid utilization regulator
MADISDAQLAEALKQYPEKGLTALAKELNVNLGSLRYRMRKLGIIC